MRRDRDAVVADMDREGTVRGAMTEHPDRLVWSDAAGGGRPGRAGAVDDDRLLGGNREGELGGRVHRIASVEDRAGMTATGDDRAEHVGIDVVTDLDGVDAADCRYDRRELRRIGVAERWRAVADEHDARHSRRRGIAQRLAEVRSAERAVFEELVGRGLGGGPAIDLVDAVVERRDGDIAVDGGRDRVNDADLLGHQRRARCARVDEDQHVLEWIWSRRHGGRESRHEGVSRGERRGARVDRFDDVVGEHAVVPELAMVAVVIDRHPQRRDRRQAVERQHVRPRG